MSVCCRMICRWTLQFFDSVLKLKNCLTYDPETLYKCCLWPKEVLFLSVCCRMISRWTLHFSFLCFNSITVQPRTPKLHTSVACDPMRCFICLSFAEWSPVEHRTLKLYISVCLWLMDMPYCFWFTLIHYWQGASGAYLVRYGTDWIHQSIVHRLFKQFLSFVVWQRFSSFPKDKLKTSKLKYSGNPLERN